MNSIRVFLLHSTIVFFLFSTHLKGQLIHENDGERGDLRIVFYNVENYFDTIDNPVTNDGEFTPSSEKKWNTYKYYIKTKNIFKTLVAVGGMSPPEIIGLCEIENDTVLKRLVWSTGLSKFPYGILHYDSPDLRGIDVGLLYRKDILHLISSQNIPISFPNKPYKMTRDILYGKLSYRGLDTLHILVNHWPSRMGGKKQSEPNRLFVASVLRHKVDSILEKDSCAKVIIMGDLNDGPGDLSVSQILNAAQTWDQSVCPNLYNLSQPAIHGKTGGSYRYRANWDLYDQIIVSGSLLNLSGQGLRCSGRMQIADLDFLLEEDTKYGGVKPKRTYLGPVYKGGFSDHLPVYMDVFLKDK